MRSKRSLVVVGLLLFVLASPVTARSEHSARDLQAQRRALAAYAAMQRYFYVPATRSYNGVYPATGHAQVWPYSQALWATLELAHIPHAGAKALAALPTRIAGLGAYGNRALGGIVYNAVYGGQTYVFYDDNAWISLALIDASDLTGDPKLLADARKVFRPIKAGWDSNPGDSCPGGVYWIRSMRNHDRGAVSTANGALIGVLLYRHAHVVYDLDWARRAYNWSQRCLGTPDGLVADHIDSAGTVDTRTWSYNQGAMIAAGVNLYRATGERRYLNDAETTAGAALALLQDPLNSGESASFLAIFYRDLLELAAVDHNESYRAAVESFANAAWTRERSPHNGLFYFGHTNATLLDQAAMVQVFAALAAT
ncbi:MAG TPA: glycoside hydrolase family 76 protein [Gaiellaceae bacterium]|jgi:predicted alpha-1,6-mannanase (GH76 family)|nr:glycoside hydrolase family 76 protein [Gaiellaceae bacterium]